MPRLSKRQPRPIEASLNPWESDPALKPEPGAKRGRKPRKGRDGSLPSDWRPPKRGQDKHQPSPEMRKSIGNMASYGLDVIMISKLAGISVSTIYRHYKHEMQTAAAQKDLMVMQSGFLKCIGGPEQNWEKADAGMIKWWVGSRQQWRPPAERTINANFNFDMDLSRLSDAQLDDLERLLEQAALEPGANSGGEAGAIIEADDGADRGQFGDD